MSTVAHIHTPTMLNNPSNNINKSETTGASRPPSRLSPRVMIGVKLNILKPPSGTNIDNTSKGPQSSLQIHRAGSARVQTARQGSPVPSSGSRVLTPRHSLGGSDGRSSPCLASPITSGQEESEEAAKSIWPDLQPRLLFYKNQLQAYMLWINSQLKKKPGARLVEDLRNDTRDGVAFIDLISVIAGETITGIHPVPSSYSEMRENVERVLHFMSSKKIKMHHLLAKDIVDGNLKSIMRLILALAAHYKPKSVKHSSHGSLSSSGSKSPNVTGIVQGASAALTAARRSAAKAGNSFRRKGREYHRRPYHHESSSDQYSDSDTSFHSDHPRIVPGRERGDVDGASAGSSPTSGSVYSPRNSRLSYGTPCIQSMSTPVSKSKSAEYISYKDSGTELEDSVFNVGHSHMVERTKYDDLMSEYQKLASAMALIKKDLGSLQDLLLSGQAPDGAESSPNNLIEGSTIEDQLVILRSQLLQSQNMCSDLREDMSRNKIELMQVQGSKAGLLQKIDAQETTISELKAELMRRELQKENFNLEHVHTNKQLKDRDKLISDLKRDIQRRDLRIDQLQQELHNQIIEKDSAIKSMNLCKQQVKDLKDKFKVVDETGASLRKRVACQDEKMARLAGQIAHTKNDAQHPMPTDEMSVLRDSLASLRQCFSLTDPNQHTLDTIEQGISSLLETMPRSSSSSCSSSAPQSPYETSASRKLNFDGTGDVRRSPITAIPGSRNSSFNANKLDSPPFISESYNTKVLYFTDGHTTPSMFTICKRLGEITLHDFKGAFDRPGQYRYHFKSLDPEFGTVKEEISNEETIIPGWEGKIVAWIEPDTDQMS